MANRLVFPAELANEDQFMLLKAHKYYRPTRSASNEKPGISEFILPIPNNLVDSTSVAYNTESLGMAGKFASEVGAAATGGVNSIADSLAGILTSTNVKESIKYYAAQAATEFAGAIPGIGDAIKGGFYGAGITRNPYEVQMFQNVNFRSHSFNYKFVPKSLDEQNTINQIVKKLKLHMLPTYTSAEKTYFKYPEFFEIVIQAGVPNTKDDMNNYLFKFKPCVLESVSVNYNPEGSPFYHDTGNGKAPVSLTVDLSFKEMLIPDRDDIEAGSNSGVSEVNNYISVAE